MHFLAAMGSATAPPDTAEYAIVDDKTGGAVAVVDALSPAHALLRFMQLRAHILFSAREAVDVSAVPLPCDSASPNYAPHYPATFFDTLDARYSPAQ